MSIYFNYITVHLLLCNCCIWGVTHPRPIHYMTARRGRTISASNKRCQLYNTHADLFRAARWHFTSSETCRGQVSVWLIANVQCYRTCSYLLGITAHNYICCAKAMALLLLTQSKIWELRIFSRFAGFRRFKPHVWIMNESKLLVQLNSLTDKDQFGGGIIWWRQFTDLLAEQIKSYDY